MKRVIFAIPILFGAWWLVQLPLVNVALFAFLTLGINPLTNHPLSTPWLISILLTLAVSGLVILFSRLLTDFFGGLVDWLTKAEKAYGANSEMASEPQEVTLSTLPARMEIEDIAVTGSPKVSALFAEFSASIPAIPIQAFIPDFQPYGANFVRGYQNLINRAKIRLQAASKARPAIETVPEEPKQIYNPDLAPELAEVVAIFEQLALQTQAAEPTEAVIVALKEPSALLVFLQTQITRGKELLGVTTRIVARVAAIASSQAGTIRKIAERQVVIVARNTNEFIREAMKTTRKNLYRGALLSALELLVAGGVLLHALNVTQRVLIRGAIASYRQVCRALVLSAVTITLSLFAFGRGVREMMHALSHWLAASCKGVYMLASNAVMVVLLGAGYMLYVFSLICLLVCEISEPYVRKIDKWLGEIVNSKEGWSEMSRVSREMSRTFNQLYREVRNMMHGSIIR
jgi:hypothetical protein